jgi:AraC-like DNA-binding protein
MKYTLSLVNSNPFKIEPEQKFEIEKRLRDMFEDKKLYTQPQFSLRHLSIETRFSTNLLSAFFNQVLGIHFNDYINRLRIRYFKEMVENENVHHLTLAGLAERCGFHNRNTFTTAFKKFVGITPSKYLRMYVGRRFSDN